MKFDFPQKIRSGYLAAFILMLLCYFLSITFFVQLRRENRWVSHTRDVINKLGIFNADLKDAEIDGHEWLLIRDSVYLNAYWESRHLADSIFTVLSKLVSDNPNQAQSLSSLHEVMVRKFQVLDEEMNLMRANGFQVSNALLKMDQRNKILIDSIGLASDSLSRAENNLLALRTRQVMFDSKWVFWIIIVAGFISFLLIMYSLVTFNMESQAKRKATIQAESYYDQLEKRVNELASANRELTELRSLERFTSTGRIARVIAHEIRNPLTNIDLSASHLENDTLDKTEKKTFLEIIARNSQRINELINELLSATRFTDLHYEAVRADELLDETLREAIDRAQLNQVDIVKNYAAGEIWLNVDRSRMKIALLNIVVNAMESMTAEHGRLILGTAMVNNQCVITIQDNGKGMDAETLNKVFDPYFTSKSSGNGLGMTNTQNIILNHRGKIEVFSEEGKGTSFVITLDILNLEKEKMV